MYTGIPIRVTGVIPHHEIRWEDVNTTCPWTRVEFVVKYPPVRFAMMNQAGLKVLAVRASIYLYLLRSMYTNASRSRSFRLCRTDCNGRSGFHRRIPDVQGRSDPEALGSQTCLTDLLASRAEIGRAFWWVEGLRSSQSQAHVVALKMKLYRSVDRSSPARKCASAKLFYASYAPVPRNQDESSMFRFRS